MLIEANVRLDGFHLTMQKSCGTEDGGPKLKRTVDSTDEQQKVHFVVIYLPLALEWHRIEKTGGSPCKNGT